MDDDLLDAEMESWEKASDIDCDNFDLDNYCRRVRYMAWCFDMHALLTRLLNWIWERIE